MSHGVLRVRDIGYTLAVLVPYRSVRWAAKDMTDLILVQAAFSCCLSTTIYVHVPSVTALDGYEDHHIGRAISSVSELDYFQ